MNTKTILNIKTDKELKKSAQETAKELGIPLTTAINSFLKQFVRDKEIIISASFKPSKYLLEIIDETEKDKKEGKISGPFNNTDDLMKHLNS